MNEPVDHDTDPQAPHAVQSTTPGGDATGRPPLPTWLKVILGILALIGGITVLLVAACFGMIAMH